MDYSSGTIYFAHPISMYGTPLERTIIDMLTEQHWKVVNPSDPEHQAEVVRIKSTISDRGAAGKAIMEYFVGLCNQCHAVAFSTFPDNTVGAGVAKEVESFNARGAEILQVNVDDPTKPWLKGVGWPPSGLIILDVEKTRAKLKELSPEYAAAARPS
jgi:hypothetical protein